jgi:hypothetical protein
MQAFAFLCSVISSEGKAIHRTNLRHGLAQDQTTAPSERLRPVTWSIWFAWVFVAALDPILSTICATAMGKQISRSAEHPALIASWMLAIIAFALLARPIMQGFVLKRVMPKLSVSLWFFCILLSGLLWLVLTASWHFYSPDLIEAGLRTQSPLERAALAFRVAGALDAAQSRRLPWEAFPLWTIATSGLISLVPAWLLGTASGLRRSILLFCAAAIGGACASAIVECIYYMTADHFPVLDWALNGMDWTARSRVLAVRGCIGAVWGATTAIVAVLMTRRLSDAEAPVASIFATHRVGGLAMVLIAPLLIAVMTPIAGHLAGPHGVAAGVLELHKALSPAPAVGP